MPESGNVPFSGPVVFENIETGDGRRMEPGAIRWGDDPVPLRWVPADTGAHDGAIVVGLVEELVREGDAILGRGMIDTSFSVGAEVARQIERGLAGGVSVDLDDVEVDIDEEGERMTVLDARIRGVTLVSIPAFDQARIALDGTTVEEMAEPVVAAGFTPPPAKFFADPGFTEPTGIRVDGRHIYGHIALWGTCHTGISGACVTPPPNLSGYSIYRTGVVLADDGSEHAVGHITMNTGHAGTRSNAVAAMSHYDHTGTVAADVVVGEDRHGIWISGAVRPGLSDEQVAALRAAPMSGDWRDVGGRLELCAVLAVNVPGFPVPSSARALVASGRTMTLRAPVPTDAQLALRRAAVARARMLADRVKE